MKLTLNYEGGKTGFNLEQNLQADIQEDAEALGYICSILFETAKVMSEYLDKVNTKYKDRINTGIAHSLTEKEREKNDVYPFTTFIIKDE